MKETITIDDGRTFTGEVFEDRGDTVLMNGEDRGIVTTYHIPSARVRHRGPAAVAEHETVTFPARETFTVHDGEEEARASAEKASCADAAQEAEHLHAETGKPHVVRGPDREVWYTSKGSPE